MAKRDYSNEEIRVALAAFATEGGRQKPTLKLLRAAGIKVPYGTLRNWAYDVHKELYGQIEIEVGELVRTQMADTYHRLARESAELSEDALRRLRSTLEESDRDLAQIEEAIAACEDNKELNSLYKLRAQTKLGIADLAKLLHESGVLGGIATDKHAVLTGRATERVEHSFPELQRALEAKGIRLAVGQGAPRALPAPAVESDG